MTFPALDDFANDGTVRPATFRVYWYLQRHRLDFVECRPVKVWEVAERLHLAPRDILSGLAWLVEQGYLIEGARATARGPGSTRTFRLAWSRMVSKT